VLNAILSKNTKNRPWGGTVRSALSHKPIRPLASSQ